MRVLFLIFILSFSTSGRANLCQDLATTDFSLEVCEQFLLRDTYQGEPFPSYLDENRVKACDDKFFDNEDVLPFCYKAASRIEYVPAENIRACASNFYMDMSTKTCLKLASLLTFSQITKCGEDSRWVGASITCLIRAARGIPQRIYDVLEN